MLCLVEREIVLQEPRDKEMTNSEAGKRELERLLSGIASGDRESLERLYELTRTAVYGFALSYLGSTHDAGDATQDTFVRIWSVSGQYKPQGTPMAWIFTICRNICLMKLRKGGREAYLDENEWDAIPEDAENITVEDRQILHEAMKKLDETERRIVIMHAVSGLKHREIAAELDMALATVLSKYRRALKKLKKHIEGGDPHEKSGG